MPVSPDKIWIDGCFDFAHHGHAGAMLQAKQLGKELFVGVHSDEEILINKGPPVMTLKERMIAVEGCRWCDHAISDAPYVTDPEFMDKYQCQYVVHGDDITTDKDGNDCYQTVKDMGRFLVVKRTDGISTTDLVGRMLLYTTSHHLNQDQLLTKENLTKYKSYASGEDGKSEGVRVWNYTGHGDLDLIVNGKSSDNFIYIDGGFDLFNPGHIIALKMLKEISNELNCHVYVGIVDDKHINDIKGKNYPIMNQFERSLCVLQSKYVDGIILNAPHNPSMNYLNKVGNCLGVYHGSTRFHEKFYDDVQSLFKYLPEHEWQNMDVESIVDRVLKNREIYEERQRKKGFNLDN